MKSALLLLATVYVLASCTCSDCEAGRDNGQGASDMSLVKESNKALVPAEREQLQHVLEGGDLSIVPPVLSEITIPSTKQDTADK